MNNLWLRNRPVQKISDLLLECFDAVDGIVRRGLSGKNVHELGHIEVRSCGNVGNLNRRFVFESFDVCRVLVDNGLVYHQKSNKVKFLQHLKPKNEY